MKIESLEFSIGQSAKFAPNEETGHLLSVSFNVFVRGAAAMAAWTAGEITGALMKGGFHTVGGVRHNFDEKEGA